MKTGVSKILITSILLAMVSVPVFGESLFTTGISKNSYTIQPRSLFSTIKAKNIGDFITVLIDETITTSDDMKLTVADNAANTDNFSTLINKVLRKTIIPKEVANFGGTSTVGNSSKAQRTTKFNDKITTQVVQVMPNGNLVIQGKKTTINSGEKLEVMVSGIIDPRFLDNLGIITSSKVANLQFAVVGKGTVSRSSDDGFVNKIIRSLF